MTSACGLKDGRVLFVRWMLRGQADVRQLCEMRTDPKTGEVLGPPHQVTQSPDLGLFLRGLQRGCRASRQHTMAAK